MTDDPRDFQEDEPPPPDRERAADKPDEEPLPPPPVGDERPPGDATLSARKEKDAKSGRPRTRRTGDDAPAPRWRDRRSRAVGWRSRDVLRAVALVLGFWVLAMLVWRTSQLWLVSFLGILFGIATSSGVDWLHARGLRIIPRGVLAALIVLGTVGTIVGFFVWSGPTLMTQFGGLRTRLPEALDQVENGARRQGGFAAGVILGGPESKARSGADTVVVAATGPEPPAPVAPVLPPRAPDTSSTMIA